MEMSEITASDQIRLTAEEMIAAAGIGDEIVAETIQSGIDEGTLTESGRTWCSSVGEFERPLARFPAAVDLNGCPPGDITAVWHTHTSEGELRNPTHSLPDYANVVSGLADVSVISGAETDHVLMGAADRDEMARRFENALGVELDDPLDVTAAVQDGRIPNLYAARDAVDQEFEALTARVDAQRPDLLTAVDDLFDPDTPEVMESTCEGVSEIECDPDTPGGDTVAPPPPPTARAPARLRSEARTVSAPLENAAERFDLVDTVVGTAVGMFTSRLLERAVFGE